MVVINSVKKTKMLVTTIIVFLLFMLLGLASYKLVNVIFDNILAASGIINPLIGSLIIIIISVVLLVGVFNKKLVSLFKR